MDITYRSKMRLKILFGRFFKVTVLVFILVEAYSILHLTASYYLFRPRKPGHLNDHKLVLKSDCECHKHEEIVIKYTEPNASVHLHNTQTLQYKTLFAMHKEKFLDSIFMCDLYGALRHGLNQSILAYSLYGKDVKYYDKLEQIVRQAKKYFPDWLIRVYHDNTIDTTVKCKIECLKQDDGINALYDTVDFCNINQIPAQYYKFKVNGTRNFDYIHAMMWRWLPLGDSLVDIFASRDSDSYILEREVDSVKVWLKSDKLGHIMRDHPDHPFEILGGLWGLKTAKNRLLSDEFISLILNRAIALDYFKANERNVNGNDQKFLTKHVYYSMKYQSVIHDSFHCNHFQDSTAWPTQRNGDCFVGGVSECNTSSTKFVACPIECRPPDHPDWTKC